MIKFVPRMTNVVLEEIPDRVTLAVEISNCQGNCAGCHSPFLKEDVGEPLTLQRVASLIEDNFGINCFLLLGEGRDRDALLQIASFVRTRYPGLETALYSGRHDVEADLWEAFDYVKVGPFVEALGPLNSPETNQRLYHHREDITARFWRKGLEHAKEEA